MAEACIELPDALVIQNIAEWKAYFSDRLAAGTLPPLDGRKLQDIDTAGLQLLVALAREADRQGLPFHWSATSDRLIEYAKALGVATQLKLDLS